MIIANTIGKKLSRQEVRSKRTAKRQQVMNQMIVWLTIGMFGIGLGYGWRMWHESQARVVSYQRFEPVEIGQVVDLVESRHLTPRTDLKKKGDKA